MKRILIVLLGLATTFSSARTQEDKIPEKKDKEETKYYSLSLISILCVMILNNYLESKLKKVKKRYRNLGKYIQVSELNTLLGIFLGLIIKIIGISEITVTIKQAFQQIFMLILLPPILFEGALTVNKGPFFKNIGSIFIFSIFGTLISILTISLLMSFICKIGFNPDISLYDCFIFGTLISATDPVSVLSTFREIKADEKLHALIFGESIMNDAVSLLLFKTLLDYDAEDGINIFTVSFEFVMMLIGSCILGLVFGFVGAYILKKVDLESSNHFSHEISTMLILPWVSFLTADSLGLSGIVTIMFCGFAMAKYATGNLSKIAKTSTKQIYKTIASNFESLAFVLIGFSVFAFPHNFEEIGVGLFLFTFLFLLLGRYCNIYGISFILDYFPSMRINKAYQFIMWFSGLRGAMAFALAIETSFKFPEYGIGSKFLTMTIFFTITTIFLFGSALQCTIDRFDISRRDLRSEKQRRNFGDVIKDKFLELDKRYLSNTFKRYSEDKSDKLDLGPPGLIQNTKSDVTSDSELPDIQSGRTESYKSEENNVIPDSKDSDMNGLSGPQKSKNKNIIRIN